MREHCIIITEKYRIVWGKNKINNAKQTCLYFLMRSVPVALLQFLALRTICLFLTFGTDSHQTGACSKSSLGAVWVCEWAVGAIATGSGGGASGLA
jgi:hypothetical protein